MEQEIERIVRLYLNVKYREENRDHWKSLNKDLTAENFESYSPDDNHILFALLLRVIDRIEGIEKLLQSTSNAQ